MDRAYIVPFYASIMFKALHTKLTIEANQSLNHILTLTGHTAEAVKVPCLAQGHFDM